MISARLHRHPLLVIHVIILGILLIGLVRRTGTTYTGCILIYVAALMVTYAVLDRFSTRVRMPVRTERDVRPFAWVVLIATMIMAVLHWSYVGGIPLLNALQQTDNIVVQETRLHMNAELPAWINYPSNFMIKAFIPFGLVVCYRKHRRLFAALALAGTLYAVSLIQKSFVITLFVPLWVMFIVERRWRSFAVLTGWFLLVLSFLMIVAKPEMVEQAKVGSAEAGTTVAPVLDEGVKKYGFVPNLARGLARRVLITPGSTVAAWFEHIPADIPFQHGGAVRPLALVTGRPFVQLDRSIYDLEYPQYAAQGTEGTVGSASFMYGWANFGRLGLLLSGVITGFLLRSITLIFAGRWKWAASLSGYPLLILSAAALPTVLLSHGWMLTILLFWWYAPADPPAS